MVKNRYEKYKRLCQKAAEALNSDSRNQQLNTLFENCDACKEINLGTYWHGANSLNAQNDSVHPKILLVGQDWGCCTAVKSQTIEEQIAAVTNHPEEYTRTFCASGNGSTTDKNLIALFDTIGYDLGKEQPDLFFTNLISYYRKEYDSTQTNKLKISGFKRS